MSLLVEFSWCTDAAKTFVPGRNRTPGKVKNSSQVASEPPQIVPTTSSSTLISAYSRACSRKWQRGQGRPAA